MLNYLREQVGIWRFKRTPLARAIQLHTQEYMHGQSALTSFNQENKERLVGEFCKRASAILSAPNPIIACREALAEFTLLFAQLQVHCLKEEEKSEQFYRANPYISGQLWRHIRDSSDHHDELARFKWETPDLTDDELVALANTRCAVALYFVNGFQIVRSHLGDRSEEKDWFRPFVEACLVNEEHQLREALGLTVLVPGALGSLIYGGFLNYVINGEPHPFYAWARDFPDAYLAGEGPPPQLAVARVPRVG